MPSGALVQETVCMYAPVPVTVSACVLVCVFLCVKTTSWLSLDHSYKPRMINNILKTIHKRTFAQNSFSMVQSYRLLIRVLTVR